MTLTLGTWQQHEEAVQGPMTDYGAWQQHEESYGGPEAYVKKSPPAAAWGDDYQESNGRVAELEAASIEGHTQA
ncbi:unnamed protein product [Staurois parvus]|uniref:Uncharacterized protein n=1 Tax=Staurois parvus TaxID=386267 RepID=A0ABN9FQT0_9NEOB|nr:unnamed protein product [Staurois parvus]